MPYDYEGERLVFDARTTPATPSMIEREPEPETGDVLVDPASSRRDAEMNQVNPGDPDLDDEDNDTDDDEDEEDEEAGDKEPDAAISA